MGTLSYLLDWNFQNHNYQYTANTQLEKKLNLKSINSELSWVLCHFAPINKPMLGKHTSNSTKTEMLNYRWQIESVADCLTWKTTQIMSCQTKILHTSPLGYLSFSLMINKLMPEFCLEFVICINISIDTQVCTHALSIALIIFAEQTSKTSCKL